MEEKQIGVLAEKRAELQLDYKKDNEILSNQAYSFIKTIYPYLTVEDKNINEYLDKNSVDVLKCMSFFKLGSCTTENVEDLAEYLQDKMTRLFTAIHSLNVLVGYGIVSYNGNTDLVIGLAGKDGEIVTKTILEGLLTGVETTPYKFNLSNASKKGGIISAVPVCKTEEYQRFDISTLMRSLNGQNYVLFFLAKPLPLTVAQDKYSKVLEVRDNCFAVSKRNISRQTSDSKSNTVSQGASHTRKGLLQEAIGQIRNKKFSLGGIIDSLAHGGTESTNESISTGNTFTVADSISHDVQNGFALEMIEYCDKAIERLRQGQNVGMWETAIAFSADKDISALILKSCLYGELAKPAKDTLPLNGWDINLEGQEAIKIPCGMLNADKESPLCVPVTSSELGMICTPPFDAVPNFELKQGKIYPMVGSSSEGVLIGKVSDGHRPLENMDFSISEKDLNKHTFVCGITGSGKTTTVKGILQNCDKPFMVIESAKKEYRNMVLPEGRKHLTVYTLGKPELNCLQFNPFYIQCGTNLQTHIDFLKDLFNASFSFYGPMPYILEKCLSNVYRNKGWNLTLGYHPYLVDMEDSVKFFEFDYMQEQYAKMTHKHLFPTMQDLKDEVKRYIEEEMQYDGEVGGNIKTAILARLESLCIGSKGFMFNTNEPFNAEKIMQENVVFELEGLADDSDKAFCVGLLVVFINEYRQIFKEQHSSEKLGLQHLLVIEEAHRLLKNVETERSSENMGNPKGKAVEHFTNMIAEMRSYGQGVIIAEQIPSKLAPDVIKNSSNKIIQRVVSADDQALIANTIGIKPEDSVYLGSLKTGYALCHKEGMSLPVFVKVNPVEDNYVSDGDLFNQRSNDVFEAINLNLVRETGTQVLPSISLKLLNTFMAENDTKVIKAIKESKDIIEQELVKTDISLAVCTNTKHLYGKILAESVIEYLTCGVYSFKGLIPDTLYTSIYCLCEKELQEDVTIVKNGLSACYEGNCQKRCARIISELIKSELTTNVDLRNSIKEYFFSSVSEDLISSIENKIKEGF